MTTDGEWVNHEQQPFEHELVQEPVQHERSDQEGLSLAQRAQAIVEAPIPPELVPFMTDEHHDMTPRANRKYNMRGLTER